CGPVGSGRAPGAAGRSASARRRIARGDGQSVVRRSAGDVRPAAGRGVLDGQPGRALRRAVPTPVTSPSVLAKILRSRHGPTAGSAPLFVATTQSDCHTTETVAPEIAATGATRQEGPTPAGPSCRLFVSA